MEQKTFFSKTIKYTVDDQVHFIRPKIFQDLRKLFGIFSA